MNKLNWIKCSDRLPEVGQRVITWSADGVMISQLYLVAPKISDEVEWCKACCYGMDGGYNDNITHWAEIEGPNEF